MVVTSYVGEYRQGVLLANFRRLIYRPLEVPGKEIVLQKLYARLPVSVTSYASEKHEFFTISPEKKSSRKSVPVK